MSFGTSGGFEDFLYFAEQYNRKKHKTDTETILERFKATLDNEIVESFCRIPSMQRSANGISSTIPALS